jgi:hypothetical protein
MAPGSHQPFVDAGQVLHGARGERTREAGGGEPLEGGAAGEKVRERSERLVEHVEGGDRVLARRPRARDRDARASASRSSAAAWSATASGADARAAARLSAARSLWYRRLPPASSRRSRRRARGAVRAAAWIGSVIGRGRFRRPAAARSAPCRAPAGARAPASGPEAGVPAIRRPPPKGEQWSVGCQSSSTLGRPRTWRRKLRGIGAGSDDSAVLGDKDVHVVTR